MLMSFFPKRITYPSVEKLCAEKGISVGELVTSVGVVTVDNKIDAIKQVRRKTDCSLPSAKTFIDRLQSSNEGWRR